MMKIIKITPRIPLGPYPQPALYGQVGNAPSKMSINIINKIVPNIPSPII